MPTEKRSLWQCYPRRYEVPLLILAAGVLLVAGLSLPILTIQKKLLWNTWTETYSVFAGIIDLGKQGEYILAAVVLCFSIIFPTLKLLMLGWVWCIRLAEAQRHAALHWLGVLGKWSMLDVFAVAMLVVVARLRTLVVVEAQVGVYYFGAAILLSMLTTTHIDRLARKVFRPEPPPLMQAAA